MQQLGNLLINYNYDEISWSVFKLIGIRIRLLLSKKNTPNKLILSDFIIILIMKNVTPILKRGFRN